MFHIYIRLFLIKDEAPERWEYSGREEIVVYEYVFSARGKEAEQYRKGLTPIFFPVFIDSDFKTDHLAKDRIATPEEKETVLSLYDVVPQEKLFDETFQSENERAAQNAGSLFQRIWPGGPLSIHKVNKAIIYFDEVYEVGGGQIWEVIIELAQGKGHPVKTTVENPQSLFKSKGAAKFWNDAIKEKNKGRGGQGMKRIFPFNRKESQK